MSAPVPVPSLSGEVLLVPDSLAIAAALTIAATGSVAPQAPAAAHFSLSWEHGRLTIAGDRPLRARQFTLRNPDRQVFDLEGADTVPEVPSRIAVVGSAVKHIRIARHPDEGYVRVVLDLATNGRIRSLESADGRRIVIESLPGHGSKDMRFTQPSDLRAFHEPFGPPAPGGFGPPAPGWSGLMAFGPPAPGFHGPAAPGWMGPPAPGIMGPVVPPVVALKQALPRFSYGSLPGEDLEAVQAYPPPEESGEPQATRSAVPWPAHPQEVDGIRLKKVKNATFLTLHAKAPLLAWLQQEPSRLTLRIPRSALRADVPRPRGAVSRMALRRDDQEWVLVLDLEDGLYVVDSRALDGGRGLEIAIRKRADLIKGTPVVVVDAGHGGYDPGAQGTRSHTESDVTMKVARRVAEALEKAGVQAVLTRTLDAEVRLADRVALMERVGAVAFVSLHCNSGIPEATGVETYFRQPSGLPLARAVHERLIAVSGGFDRGVRAGQLFVLRGDRIPSALVEMGFISNATEEERLADPAYQKIVAKAIAGGISEFLDARPIAGRSLGPGS